ncbi:hypothetical protein ARALYDRAFT_903930 [Arabidopsis lyrata subsp. lyrata]|uniref:Uncharacterized protein n=1 Tax=Arabidopsis lyrata subsp. lyrata TaxID=81972 RepID=D7LBT9_ARALL|nr:hypothetical protein ARALYDRAFT_903930 [Arabidopsis lyrata subsp. lyrata]
MSTSGGSVLNAYALEFNPNPDKRCIFVTFSNGFPLTESQIFGYFDRQVMYPGSVVDVYVHKPRPTGRVARQGLFGKVMFNSHYIPGCVLGHCEKVCVVIDGRPMYCRRFVSQRSRTANAAALGDRR